MRIYLGNPSAGEGDSEAVTIIDAPDSNTLLDVLSDVKDLWGYHGSDNPSWVASDNDSVAQALSQQFGGVLVKHIDEGHAAYQEAAGQVQPPEPETETVA